MKFVRSILMFIGGLFVLVVIAGAIFGGGSKDQAQPADSAGVQASTATATAPLPEQAAVVSAAELAAAYEENSVSADNLFKGKRLQVTGVIADINTDMFGDAYIAFKAGNEFMRPQAKFVEKQVAASLKKGSKVTLICTGAGDVMKTPMLKDCSPA